MVRHEGEGERRDVEQISSRIEHARFWPGCWRSIQHHFWFAGLGQSLYAEQWSPIRSSENDRHGAQAQAADGGCITRSSPRPNQFLAEKRRPASRSRRLPLYRIPSAATITPCILRRVSENFSPGRVLGSGRSRTSRFAAEVCANPNPPLEYGKSAEGSLVVSSGVKVLKKHRFEITQRM